MGGGIDAKRGAPRGGSSSSVEAAGFDGQLRCASLADLIQLECSTRARNAVSVHSEGREGHLFFDDGQIVHAIANGLEGESAVFELLGWTTGTFGVSSAPWPAAPTVTNTWQQLLLSAAQRRDEQQRDLPGVSQSRLKAVRSPASTPPSERSPQVDPWPLPSLRPSPAAPLAGFEPASLEPLDFERAGGERTSVPFEDSRVSARPAPPRYASRRALAAAVLAVLALGIGWAIESWWAHRTTSAASPLAHDQDGSPVPPAASAPAAATRSAPEAAPAPTPAPITPPPTALPRPSPGTPSASSAATASAAPAVAPPTAAPAPSAASTPARELAPAPAAPTADADLARRRPAVVRRPAPPAPRPNPETPAAKPPEPPAARAWDNDSPLPP